MCNRKAATVLCCRHGRGDKEETFSSHHQYLVGPHGVEGLGTGKDFKLYPGGGREWDWRETHTERVPGIQPADVQELLDRGSKVMVLSRGMQLMLRTCPETLQLLKDNGVGVYVKETRKAAELYNKLTGREPVGGLFHSTC